VLESVKTAEMEPKIQTIQVSATKQLGKGKVTYLCSNKRLKNCQVPKSQK